jgi:tRNA uridine 5-carboxymethylaminomethyl modification enzyme
LEPDEINPLLESAQSSALVFKQKALQLLLRPNIGLEAMVNAIPKLQTAMKAFDRETLEQVEILTKYETYINKERELVAKMGQLEDLIIPDSFSYDKLVSLSNEARQKFTKIRPRTLGQASRISGVNPSDVQILMVFMGR